MVFPNPSPILIILQITSLWLTLRASRWPKQKQPSGKSPRKSWDVGHINQIVASPGRSWKMGGYVPVLRVELLASVPFQSPYRLQWDWLHILLYIAAFQLALGFLTRAIHSQTVVGSVCWRQESPGFLLNQSCWCHPLQGSSCLTLWGVLDRVTFLFTDKGRYKVLKTSNPSAVSCFLFGALKNCL